MMTTCSSCGSTTTNGLNLCDLCRQGSGTALEFLGVYYRNLCRWKPADANTSRPVPSSRPPAGAFAAATVDEGPDTVDRALNAVGADLARWVGKLVYERTDLEVPDLDNEADTATAMCTLLAENVTTIAALSWAGDFAQAVTRHQDRLQLLTETFVPGWYAGTCTRMVGVNDDGQTVPCGHRTYVVPGLAWAKCTGCGLTSETRDNLGTILSEAADWVDRPMRLAEILVALLDTEPSTARLHKRIATWGERERIPAYRSRDADGDETGPKRYRLGDVLARLRSDGPTLTDSLDDLRARLARPTPIAALIVAKFDAEQSVTRLAGRIRKWGQRGPDKGGLASKRDVDANGLPIGPRLYRLGDVLDRLNTETNQAAPEWCCDACDEGASCARIDTDVRKAGL